MFEFTPYASLHYSYLDTDGYTETGAGATNLTVGGEGTDVLQSALGVSISKEMIDADGNSYVPEAHISWLHEYLDEEQTNTSTFAGGGASFTTKGFDPASDSINAGASLGIFSVDNIDVRASYDYEGKSDYNSHSGMVILRYKF